VDAKKKIAKIVDSAERLSRQTRNAVEREKIRTEALRKIAAVVAQVEIAKAESTKVILEVTADVERTKTLPQRRYVDAQSALTIARNRSAVRIAKAVSAVEIARAAARVELSRTEGMDANEGSAKVSDSGIDLVRSKAQAAISTARARVEVAHANAMAEIANAVSNVEIAKRSSTEAGLSKTDRKTYQSGYPEQFLYFKKQY